jgi:glycosyltransferase involved in cell wall biosynthesis
MRRVAILIPCRDEAVAIGDVVRGFRAALPEARICVFDNASTDGTAEVARAAGAEVFFEARPGKGQVVRRMFADIKADAYLLVDGDGTYDAAAAPALLDLLFRERLDMVTGARVPVEAAAAYRPGHAFGNRAITGAVRLLFGAGTSDMLSGYRAFSRRFVKSFPALATGFETETEFTVHALELGLPVGEIATRYAERPAGSASKLRTWRDGWRILLTILNLVKRERPLPFFGLAGFGLAVFGLLLFLPVLAEYMATGLVPRLPTAVLSLGLVLAGLLSLACGLVLETVTRGRLEARRMAYLAQPGPEA